MSASKLLLMNSHRVFVVASALVFNTLVACDSDQREVSMDSAAAANASRPKVVVPPAPSTGWDEAAGPALILPTSTEPSGAVAVVLPQLTDSMLASAGQLDLTALSNSRVELFSPRGRAGEATVSSITPRPVVEGCQAWPQGVISATPKTAWQVGFIKGRATAMPVDSIEGMSDADSAAFTRDIMSLMSLPSKAEDSAFTGLPFAVRKAYRFSSGSTKGFIASSVRKINEEANPRQEHFLIVAERSGDVYKEVFRARTAGSEESVQTHEVLALVNLVETGRTAIVVSFESEVGRRLGLLERASDSRWRVVWRSAYAGC